MSSDLYRNQIAHQYFKNIAEFRHNSTCRCAIPNPFSLGTQVFGDERLTAALLDRLIHRAHVLEFTGESFRFRQRMQREVESEGQE